MTRWAIAFVAIGLSCSGGGARTEGLPQKAGASQTKKAPTLTTQFDRNLLKNGGGEIEGAESKDVANWKRIEGLTGAKYGSVSGEWDWGLSGCASCGTFYLRLQFDSSTQELSTSQTVDVGPSAAEIDKGNVTAKISAYLGGFLESDTSGTVSASFQDADGKELGKVETKPYETKTLPKPEKGSSGLTLCEASGAVPAGTRKIVYTWKASATGTSGDYLGLGDNFSLVLSLPKTAQP